MDKSIPIIKLEVDHMKHTMMVALSKYTAQLDRNLQEAVERFCTPENLQRIIENEADKQLDIVIREQVRAWFNYGEGRDVIKRAVEQKLKDATTWTPLDKVK
jgi:hypothetical protein